MVLTWSFGISYVNCWQNEKYGEARAIGLVRVLDLRASMFWAKPSTENARVVKKNCKGFGISRHWRNYHWATWAMPPPLWAVDRKCSKLKLSHTAIIAARVAKQRRQRNSIWFVHKTVNVVPFPQTLLPPLLQVFRHLRQLNESSTASQEHDPTGSVSNNRSTIDIAKRHVLEYRRCWKHLFITAVNCVTNFFQFNK